MCSTQDSLGMHAPPMLQTLYLVNGWDDLHPQLQLLSLFTAARLLLHLLLHTAVSPLQQVGNPKGSGSFCWLCKATCCSVEVALLALVLQATL